MKKKILALLLAMAMALSLGACGGSDNDGNSKNSDQTQNGGQAQNDSGGSAQTPDGGAQTPDDNGAQMPPPQEENQTGMPSLSEIFEQLQTVNADVASLSSVEGEVLDSWYPGLAAAEGVEEVMVMEPEISFSAMAVALVRLSEDAAADQIQAVKDILQDRLDSQASGGAYYLSAQEAWGEGVVAAYKNYVGMFVCSGEARDLANCFLTYCGGEALPEVQEDLNEEGDGEGQTTDLDGRPVIPIPGAETGTDDGAETGGEDQSGEDTPATPSFPVPSFPVPGSTGDN